MGNKKADVALGTYEIENNDFIYLKNIKSEVKFDYIDTSICYNNDYYISSMSSLDDKKIISKIPPQMYDDYEFYISNHLKFLKRNEIDIMLIHNPRADWTGLAIKMSTDNRFKEIGVSNFSIDEIERFKLVTGKYPKYNEFEINPNYYDKELIDYCHDKEIKIISYAVLGGKYNARKNISKYTLGYLLSFVYNIADIVIIRSDNIDRLKLMTDYLYSNLISELCIDYPDVSVFNKSIEPLNYNIPSIQSILSFKGNKLIPSYDNDMSIRTRFSFMSEFEDSDFDKNLNIEDKIDGLVYDRFIKLNPPSTLEFITDYRVYYRYKIMEVISRLYPEDRGFKYHISNEPDMLIVGVYKKRFFLEDKLEKSYIFNVVLYDKSTKKLSKISTPNTELKLNFL